MPFDFTTTAQGVARSLGVGSLSTKPSIDTRPSGLKRLFRNLYRAISRDPRKVLALRPTAPGNLRWTIQNAPAMAPRTLLIQRPGASDVSVSLENATVAQVRDNLTFLGVDLDFVTEDPVLLNLSALSLMPGTGEKWQSNGDHIYIRRSLLWAWGDPIGRWLDRSRLDIAEMLRMLVVRQSGGQWSDLWASYFGLQRKPGETDDKLNLRTEWEWRRPRNNAKAMELNIRHLLDQQVTVREPWKEMMIVSGSMISGGDHLPNEQEFAYHRAQLQSREVYDWGPATEEAQADRPAGTLLISPVTYPWPWHIEAPPHSLDFGSDPTFSAWILDYDGQIISVTWDLSDTYVLLNPTLAMSEELQFDQTIIEGRGGDIGNRLTFAKGEIVLSEQWNLGYEEAPGAFDLPVSQQRLGGRRLQEFGEGLILSDAGGLSDYEHALRLVPIDEWLLDRRSYDPPTPLTYPTPQPTPNVELSIGSEIVSTDLTADAGTQTDISMGAQFAYDTGWNGRWTARPWSFGFRRPVADFRSLQALPDGLPLAVQGSHSANLFTRKQFASAQVVTNSAQASLTTAIKLAGAVVNQPSYLVTFGAAIRMAGTPTASPAAVGALSTQIALSAALVAPGGTPMTAPLDTAITLQGQAIARASVVKSAFAVAEISATIQNVAYSFGALSTASPLSAALTSDQRASVVLTVGPRFNAAAGSGSTAQADLYTEARFASATAATSTASAFLQIGARFQGVALGQSSAGSQVLLVGAPAQLQAASGAVASIVTANLLVGVRFVAAKSAVATSAAALTALGPQAWPTANRSWLFDPDDSSKRVLSGTQVQTLNEVGGNTDATFANSQSAGPGLVTINNRGFLNFFSGGGVLDGGTPMSTDFRNASAAATFHMVFRTGSSLWQDIGALVGDYNGGDSPSAMLGVESTSYSRAISDWTRNASDTRWDWRSSAPSWAVNTTYLLTWRRNGNGTTDFFIDGVKLSATGTTVPAGTTDTGALGCQLGTYWPDISTPNQTNGVGYIGAVMRYGVAQSDATIANIAAVKNSKYSA